MALGRTSSAPQKVPPAALLAPFSPIWTQEVARATNAQPLQTSNFVIFCGGGGCESARALAITSHAARRWRRPEPSRPARSNRRGFAKLRRNDIFLRSKNAFLARFPVSAVAPFVRVVPFHPSAPAREVSARGDAGTATYRRPGEAVKPLEFLHKTDPNARHAQAPASPVCLRTQLR